MESRFRPSQRLKTACLTLYCRALDNRLPKPVLSDTTAGEIVRKLDYDFEQFKVNEELHPQRRTLSQKSWDEVASGFIRHRYPDARRA